MRKATEHQSCGEETSASEWRRRPKNGAGTLALKKRYKTIRFGKKIF